MLLLLLMMMMMMMMILILLLVVPHTYGNILMLVSRGRWLSVMLLLLLILLPLCRWYLFLLRLFLGTWWRL
jgi:hypothetical protein